MHGILHRRLIVIVNDSETCSNRMTRYRASLSGKCPYEPRHQKTNEQLTECFEPLQKLRAGLGPLYRFMYPQFIVFLTWFYMLHVLESLSVLFSPICLDVLS